MQCRLKNIPLFIVIVMHKYKRRWKQICIKHEALTHLQAFWTKRKEDITYGPQFTAVATFFLIYQLRTSRKVPFWVALHEVRQWDKMADCFRIREVQSDTLKNSKLLWLHCVDMNVEISSLINELPCLEWLALLGHVSVPERLNERRMVLLPKLSSMLGALQQSISPIFHLSILLT